jgi:ubiquinone/menaquinone biosynthesis C-methylase UbiE
MFFLRKSSQAPLPVAMSGVKMGERALQIGIDDPAVAGALAAKVGLSGHAAMALVDEAAAAKARAAAANAGALVDVHVAPLDALPFGDNAFDVIVVHGISGLLSSLDAAARVAALRESARVLRPGGRIVIIESAPRGGIGTLVRPRIDKAYEESGGAAGALAATGFRASRVLAEREGYRFSEGMKSQP